MKQDAPTPRDSIYQTGEYVRNNPTYHVEDSPWKARYILAMIDKHRLRPQSVCEIGCGAGEVLRQLQAQMPAATEFFGYEVSPEAFAMCKSRENGRLRYYCDDLLSTDATFDLLLCIDVFEHVEDYFSFLRRLRDKAKLKIFHIPLDLSVQSVLRGRPILLQRKQAGHLHYFTKETALATLHDTGYKVIDVAYTPGAIVNPRSIKAKLARWPRKLLSHANPDLVARILGGYSLLVLAE